MIEFLNQLAIIDSKMLSLNLKLEKTKVFKNISYSSRIYYIDKTYKKIALDVYFNSELFELIDNDIHTLSMDISISIESNRWQYDGYVNWYGYDTGGQCEIEIEESFNSLELLVDNLEQLYNNTEQNYLSVIEKYKNESRGNVSNWVMPDGADL